MMSRSASTRRTLPADVRRLVESTRRQQGLPPTVTDDALLDKLAAIVTAGGAPTPEEHA